MTDSPNKDSARGADPAVFAARLGIALLQAAALYFLAEAALAKSWPTNNPAVYQPLLFCAGFVPFVILIGLGQIRARPLAVWALCSAGLIGLIGYARATRDLKPASSEYPIFDFGFVWFALSLFLFIAQALVVDSVRERKLAPSYLAHFDTAWKQGVQIILASVFVGVTWVVLYSGAKLFGAIHFDFFDGMIREPWFYYPATTLAFAVAFHVTDVQPHIIRGARSLALTLFSWLLPLSVVILGGFLVALIFGSVETLWATHFDVDLLIGSAALLIFFINCCYQDGSAEGAKLQIKRYAASLGALELIPIIGLAIWALALRTQEYGWSVRRIEAGNILAIGGIYAIGYGLAVVASPSWLKRIESVNLVAAYAILGAIFAFYTPIADPARLMVANQLARLQSGTVDAKHFDFVSLRFDGARWGAAALVQLSQQQDGPDATAVRARAQETMDLPSRWDSQNEAVAKLSGRSAGGAPKNFTILPSGRVLPAKATEYVEERSTTRWLRTCLHSQNMQCTAHFFTLSAGEPEAIVFSANSQIAILEQDEAGNWRESEHLLRHECWGNTLAFDHAEITAQSHDRPDLIIGGVPFSLIPASPNCGGP